MDGRQHEPAARQPEFVEDMRLLLFVRERDGDSFDDGVAGDLDAFRGDALGQEVVPGQWGRGAAQVGEVVDEHTVVFFGHRTVEAAQTGFEMHQMCAGGVGGQRSGQSRGGVSLHEHGIGFVLTEDQVEGGHEVAELVASADVAVVVGIEHDVWRDLPGHASAEVLAGVHDERLAAKELGDRGEFDGFGAGAHDDGDSHRGRSGCHQNTCVRSPAQNRRAATNRRR